MVNAVACFSSLVAFKTLKQELIITDIPDMNHHVCTISGFKLVWLLWSISPFLLPTSRLLQRVLSSHRSLQRLHSGHSYGVPLQHVCSSTGWTLFHCNEHHPGESAVPFLLQIQHSSLLLGHTWIPAVCRPPGHSSWTTSHHRRYPTPRGHRSPPVHGLHARIHPWPVSPLRCEAQTCFWTCLSPSDRGLSSLDFGVIWLFWSEQGWSGRVLFHWDDPGGPEASRRSLWVRLQTRFRLAIQPQSKLMTNIVHARKTY